MEVDVIVNGHDQWRSKLVAAVADHERSLGRTIEIRPVIALNIDPYSNVPLVVFFGDSPSALDEAKLEVAIEHRFVLPVCESAEAAGRLPAALSPVNAFLADKYGDGWPVALADLLMSRLWVGRTVPKAFISYKRTDSQKVADQLFDELTRRQFDVFLDDCSIPRGADFQRELKFWLNDADLVLLLVTPNVPQSKWVLEEIEFAKSAQVGFLMLVWPEVHQELANTQSAVPTSSRDYLRELLDRVFEEDRQDVAPGPDGRLSDLEFERIVERALERRTENLVNRLYHLLPYAEEVFGAEGDVSPGIRLGDIVVAGEEQRLVRVFPYRPGIVQFYDVYRSAQGEDQHYDAIGCFYNENDPSHESVAALRWAVQESAGPARLLRSMEPRATLMYEADLARYKTPEQKARYREVVNAPCVFLSASAPYLRPEPTPDNLHYVHTAKLRRILDAVSYLTQTALQLRMNLVFGGHPAISPMVLDIARRFLKVPAPRIAVFQSEFFLQRIPRATLDLAEWDYGCIRWTPREPDLDTSLTTMREQMLRDPSDLRAGVFIGGMEGCIQEANLFKQIHSSVPAYAIGSTGSAAADLLSGLHGGSWIGRRMAQTDLANLRSYPLLVKRIFDDVARP